MTHPFIGDLAKAHLAELHAAASRQRVLNEVVSRRRLAPAEVSGRTLHHGARRKAGWWLVGVGLRLATGSADA